MIQGQVQVYGSHKELSSKGIDVSMLLELKNEEYEDNDMFAVSDAGEDCPKWSKNKGIGSSALVCNMIYLFWTTRNLYNLYTSWEFPLS